MNGNSGAQILHLSDRVYKRSGDKRLLTQANLQREFKTAVPELSAIPVFGVSDLGNEFEIAMPFVAGVCPLSHDATIVHTQLLFIEECLKKSTIGDVSPERIMAKMDSIERGISNSPLAAHSSWHHAADDCRFALRDGLKDIPLGPCHGDFTFSNMLQNETGIVLFDFLDNIFSSPLLDMVKLRQDTACRLRLGTVVLPDDTKLARVDSKLDHELNLFDCYRKYYRPLQQMNLLRILPYCSDSEIVSQVVTELVKL